MFELDVGSAEKVRLLRSRFPPPPHAERRPPNPGLVAAVAAELWRRGGRWRYLPSWVFFPAVRRIAWRGFSFDEAWAWAVRRVTAEPAKVDDAPLGPCLSWEPIPPSTRRPAWVPAPATLGEIRAKPGVPARIYTWNQSKTAADNAARRLRSGKVDDLPKDEWVATPRVLGNPDLNEPTVRTALWLTYDRRRKDEPVKSDRRRKP